MIVRKIDNHVSSARSFVEPPQSTRAVNLGTGKVDTISRTPMPLTQTVRRPQPSGITNVDLASVELEAKPLSVSWAVDFDIIGLNIKITAFIKGKKSRKEQIQKLIVAAQEQLAKTTNVDDISACNVKIASLQVRLEEVSQVSLMDYLSQTRPLLEAYKKIASTGPQVFGQKEVFDVVVMSERTRLVEAYLQIAARYYPLLIKRTSQHVLNCPNCQGTLLEENHQYVCAECQTTQSKMEVHAEPSNESELHSYKKSHYDSGRNLVEIVKQFQGDYPVVIGEAVLGAIRAHLEKYNGFDIKKATNYDILGAMKSLGLGSWYKHINKIRFLITGKKPRDIGAYVPRIIRRAELFSEIYDSIKPDDRTNFIHGLHFLWISLMNEGAEIDMEDFCLLKSRDCELKGLDAMRRGFPVLAKSHPEFRWELHQIP